MKVANPTEDIVKTPADTAIISAVSADNHEVMDSAEIHRQIVTLVHEDNIDCNEETETASQTEVTIPAHYFDSEVFQPNVLRLKEWNTADLAPIDWESLLNHETVTVDQRRDLIALLDANRDVFATSVSQVGMVSCVKHVINLKPEAKIVRQWPYRSTPEKQEALNDQIQELLQARVVTESDSPWLSPVVMIKERNKAPDGSDLWQTCIDYRALNAMTLKDAGYFAMQTFDGLYDSISRQ